MAAKPHHNSLLNILSVIVFGILALLLTWELTTLRLPWYILLITACIGYILADFTSGLVHFIGDTFGSEKTPLIGKAFIFPFREHHTDQTAITRHNFFVTNGHNCLVSLPVMLAMHIVLPYAQSKGWIAALFSTGYFLVLSVFATNQIHKWAHMKNPPRLIRIFQYFHIILNPKHHAVHHTAPHTSYFCITTGWLNPILEKVHFFDMMRMCCGKKRLQKNRINYKK